MTGTLALSEATPPRHAPQPPATRREPPPPVAAQARAPGPVPVPLVVPPLPDTDPPMEPVPPTQPDDARREATEQASASRAPRASVAPSRGRLVLIARDGGEGPSYPLADVTDIGRSEGSILIADDRYVSPRHARLMRRGDQVFLRDLGSVNGIYVRIPSGLGSALGAAHGHTAPHGVEQVSASGASPTDGVSLQDQDLFLVGQQVLRFEVVRDAEEGFGSASQHGTLMFGTPLAPRYARLSQRTVEGVTRDVFYIRKVETVLGRESGDIVFTDDPFLSRRHAVIRCDRPSGGDAKRFTLADLGSSNGTFLQIREEVRVKDGDHFRLGQQLFRIDLDARLDARGGASRSGAGGAA